ncbi:MAG TPA: hypothetical protein EYG11_20440 [Candidatus Latescibacteria bacterium]|nr:hypothetical protein [Candidatus Handelsmanbacteria bacterium]HIL11072.1 hypothetical protein [Candidatus Latescibacterota bacterium]
MSLSSLVCLALLVFASCSSEEANQRFSDPAATFQTYKHALEESDFDLLWECFSLSQKESSERQAWIDDWRQKTQNEIKSHLRREIAQEQIINKRIAYLLFDTSTLGDKRASPFFYFIHEPDGWKITSHLDTTFHQELEQAIESGEYKLPEF